MERERNVSLHLGEISIIVFIYLTHVHARVCM